MPFEPHNLIGYAPTIEEIMKDISINDPADFVDTLLLRCEMLYLDAKKRGSIRYFDTPRKFILCDSSKFYQTLVNMGQGNAALCICEDDGPRVYFLMFGNKVPVRFRKVVASHESFEYYALKEEGLDQILAHEKASEKEIETAGRLGIKKDYLDYLKARYPAKWNLLKEWGLI